MKIKINEIFYSLDGEGKRTGKPSIFIRLTGCNLRCNYCDTKYSFNEGEYKEIDEILEEIKKYKCNNITITGGEPLLQENIYILLEKLKENNNNIIIETNGAVDIKKAKRFASICMDWKAPSSEMNNYMIEENLKELNEDDVLKIVIRNTDLTYLEKFLQDFKIKSEIYISPVYNEIELVDIANFIKNYKGSNDLRVQVQLHKIIWKPEERGV